MTTTLPAAPVSGGPERLERIPTVIIPDHNDLALALADRMAEVITRESERKGKCVLGLATGSTPIGIYRELGQRVAAGTLDMSRVVTFNLDEYFPMEPFSIHSYRRFMWENLFAEINVDPRNVHIPDGAIAGDDIAAHCDAFEQRIADEGGIDFQILGIGRSGHIGFNEPGSDPQSRTRLVTLDTVTRKDAAADFFGEENVPRQALTMGIATILDAREIVLIATGEHKAKIVKRAVEGPVSTDVTATFLQEHPHASVYLDAGASADLTRISTPWVVRPVEWNDAQTERAAVWLAETTGKPLLKLTAADYSDHHLSPLLAHQGSAGPINGDVFNRLNSRITGRSRLPRGQKVIVFSPHPDDDVISMGGVLRKFCENENDITVAYMTSGNIAVFDHDVRRHLDFLVRAAGAVGVDEDIVARAETQVLDALQRKQPAEIDIDLVQNLKRFIRESEAVSAIEFVGLDRSAARFLNLPFYQTGAVKKRPIGDEDLIIIRSLLEEVKPDIVFAAGDLSDPHGTHRVCLDAIYRSLEAADIPRPDVWLYRGAWQEWPLTEADRLVPLSQDEMRLKRFAIFKHQSQKDTAPFPGSHDDREFWQRVEDRNLETAAKADRLGLPEYFAMEAYRVEPGDRSDP